MDAGGLFAPQQKAGDEARNRALLEGMVRMEVAVVNLSPTDALLLPRLGPRPKLPVFVSANVRHPSGQALAPPYIIRGGASESKARLALDGGGKSEARLALDGGSQTRPTARIAFVGLSAVPLPEVPGVTVDDPQAALHRLLPELRQKADSIVLLAYMPNRDVVSIAANFPEVDAIVTAYEHQGAAQPYQIGRAWILQSEYEGKFVGHAGLEFGSDRRLARLAAPGIQVLDHTVADQPELAALVARAKK